jgi:hypothetical protein
VDAPLVQNTSNPLNGTIATRSKETSLRSEPRKASATGRLEFALDHLQNIEVANHRLDLVDVEADIQLLLQSGNQIYMV